MDDTDLISRACETAARYLALGNECFDARGARFVRNRNTPNRYDANHIGLIRSAAGELEAMLRRADEEFADFGYRRFDVDPLTPAQIVARLALDGGYSVSETLWLVLEGELKAETKPADIREISSEDEWQAYGGLIELDWVESRLRLGTPFGDARNLAQEWLTYARAKAPAVRAWLAYADGAARAYFSSWPGENGIGMVEDLFTHPDFRHRGLATALVAHCVADARKRGAGPVIIGADPTDTPKAMYAAMGFRPLFVSRNYFRTVDASAGAGSDPDNDNRAGHQRSM